MRAWLAAPPAAVTASSSSLNLRRAGAWMASTSTGSARHRSSSQVMLCSKAAISASDAGASSPSDGMNPQLALRVGSPLASGIDAHEVEHGVFVDDGRVLDVAQIAVVFEIGVGEHE